MSRATCSSLRPRSLSGYFAAGVYGRAVIALSCSMPSKVVCAVSESRSRASRSSPAAGAGPCAAAAAAATRGIAAIGVLERGGHAGLRGGVDALLIFGEEVQVRDAADGERRGASAQDAGQRVADADGADRPVALAGEQVAVEPAVGADGVAADAGFPGVLLLEVRAGVPIIAHRLERHRLPLVEQRGQRRRARVQAEKAVEVHDAARLAGIGERDALAQFVVAGVFERHDEVDAVHAAAQENRHERLAFADGEQVVGVQPRVGEDAPGRRCRSRWPPGRRRISGKIGG